MVCAAAVLKHCLPEDLQKVLHQNPEAVAAGIPIIGRFGGLVPNLVYLHKSNSIPFQHQTVLYKADVMMNVLRCLSDT